MFTKFFKVYYLSSQFYIEKLKAIKTMIERLVLIF